MVEALDDAGTMRLRLRLAYDGAGFHGWAVQPGLRTVQGEVEGALARILRPAAPLRLTVAGRTDAGVHARAQAAHVDVPVGVWANAAAGLSQRPTHGSRCDGPGAAAASCTEPEPEPEPTATAQVLRRVNAVLAPDVRVFELCVAPRGFDARFSAVARRYCYRIADRLDAQDPLTHGQIWWSRHELDVGAMNVGAAHLLGEHDFVALCRPRPGASTVRRVIEARVGRAGAGPVELWVEADAFCHSMVRSIAGALVGVGEGRCEPEWIAALLGRTSREGSVTVLPAHGLTLEAVRYPEPDALAATAEAHRTVRGPLH